MKDEINGLVGYQHPARWKNDMLTEKADYFSELVIYITLKTLSIDSSYWQRLNIENTETLLFSGDDIASGGKSPIFNDLRKIPEITPLVDTLCEFISYDSIDKLIPLEQAVVSRIDEISSKWVGGNESEPSQPHIDNSGDIMAKWGNGNGYKPKNSKEQANDIGDKWKKK